MSFFWNTSDSIAGPPPRQRLHEWLSCPAGERLLNRERELLGRVLPHLFGHFILQVGRLGEADLLARSRITNRIVVEVDREVNNNRNLPGPTRLRAEPDALPLASDSVDVVVLPHLLEFSLPMEKAIREAERVLVAEGHLLILAFNAWSFMGIWRLLCPERVLGRGLCAPPPPCQGGQFPGLTRIRNRIATLGFEVVSMERYFFQPPMDNRRLSAQLDFLDVFGPRFWPFFSGAYFIVAKKRVTTFTPIRLRQRTPRQSLIPVGLGESSSRSRFHKPTSKSALS